MVQKVRIYFLTTHINQLTWDNIFISKKTDNDDSPRAVSKLNGFKVGDSVKVKEGIKDPDDDKNIIGNCCGRIAEIYDDGIALIEWDSITIRGMDIKKIRKYEKEGLLWGKMYLGLDELEKTAQRDKKDDADEEISKIQWQYFRKEYFPD